MRIFNVILHEVYYHRVFENIPFPPPLPASPAGAELLRCVCTRTRFFTHATNASIRARHLVLYLSLSSPSILFSFQLWIVQTRALSLSGHYGFGCPGCFEYGAGSWGSACDGAGSSLPPHTPGKHGCVNNSMLGAEVGESTTKTRSTANLEAAWGHWWGGRGVIPPLCFSRGAARRVAPLFYADMRSMSMTSLLLSACVPAPPLVLLSRSRFRQTRGMGS